MVGGGGGVDGFSLDDRVTTDHTTSGNMPKKIVPLLSGPISVSLSKFKIAEKLHNMV